MPGHYFFVILRPFFTRWRSGGQTVKTTDKEVCINQLRNDLNATRKELESEKLQNSALCEENSALKAQCVKSEFENSVLRKYILLSKEKIAVTGTVPCQHEGAKRPGGRAEGRGKM